jgi:hypothetical protein
MNSYDKITSMLWTGVGVGIITASSQLTVGSWSMPGPGFLPLLTGVVTVVCGLLVFIQAWFRGNVNKSEGTFLWGHANFKKVLLVLISLFLYTILLNYLGYLTITFLFIYSVTSLIGGIRSRTALSEAAVITFLSYALFKVWLEVPLPKGPWGF